MKKYFAKYLPVEGEIKEGDYFIRTICGTIMHAGDARITEKANLLSYLKVKLFLCSRDIQIGDKFHRLYTGNSGFTSEMECIGADNDTLYSQGINDDIYNSRELCFKVIGEISPEAKWVKEGDEFDETELLYLLGCSSIRREMKYFNSVKQEWRQHPEDIVIFVKGPCGHFH